jgi:hypothetical protein
MDAPGRDDTRDWLIPERDRPPLLGELVVRIDEAMATARSSEAAVMTVGAAALDAAEQARRAADLAERASAALLDRDGPPAAAGDGDDNLRDFSARADRVAARLTEIERSSFRLAPASGAEALRPQAV